MCPFSIETNFSETDEKTHNFLLKELNMKISLTKQQALCPDHKVLLSSISNRSKLQPTDLPTQKENGHQGIWEVSLDY